VESGPSSVALDTQHEYDVGVHVATLPSWTVISTAAFAVTCTSAMTPGVLHFAPAPAGFMRRCMFLQTSDHLR
jgi:hypothetical protein